MTAVGITGALVAGIVAAVDNLWPGTGTALSPTISGIVTAIVMFIAGYMTTETK